ncbi:MAG: tRNA (adenosine(37)-N6)-threonylcarbamoyltransferase complex dimerization subunit type 1 TsaB [Candidatus Marinimicrobia bacterium]|nr:tRNA (adenosine(37)-N6)-threonylcarbamoyltransferase complex dimerization subunit type 1 TsaB [Candidatus Neomarinimicrobiota bacterium]
MVIACDTSSVVCSVAIADQDQIVFQREAIGGQIHIEKLSLFLQEALDFCKVEGKKVSALALAIGPGSFNGLRIGLATMKALALARELPLIPIVSTDAMALGLRQQLSGRCRAVIFSHRNFVHYADYDLGNEYPLVTPTFHYGPWDKLPDPDIDHYFGTADRGFAQWLNEDQATGSIKDRFHHLAADAGQVAFLAQLRHNQATPDLDQLEPFYNAEYEAKKWIPPTF